MHKVSKDRRGRLTRAALVAVGGVSSLMAAGHASAAAINVAFANNAVVQPNNDATAFGANNHGITPFVYGGSNVSVPLTTIANFSGKTYDGADTADTGNTWNSLQAVTTNLAANTTGVTYILEEQNVPLVDSSGAATGVTLSQYLRLPNNKGTADGVRVFQNSTTAGTDGLLPNPINSLNSSSSPGDGYGTGASHLESMGTGWSLNGTAEGLGFTLSGLAASTQYVLYLFSGGTAVGQGGNFTGVTTLSTDPTTGVTTGGTLTGTGVQTNTVAASNFRSIVDGTGDPLPEQGKSWNALTLTSDASGNLSFSLSGASAGGIKPIFNAFQIDTLSTTPEPGSLALLGFGSLGLLARRKRSAV
ncbi:MAG TPA: PEP-CTERM sorting domain-containing protein [Tepidisphaeraceae bacterium]|jgi:hypothetical protein|nr:PEP-CTERM sorting domain-containing protein [Tepidisphaeraceae bacterium]